VLVNVVVVDVVMVVEAVTVDVASGWDTVLVTVVVSVTVEVAVTGVRVVQLVMWQFLVMVLVVMDSMNSRHSTAEGYTGGEYCPFPPPHTRLVTSAFPRGARRPGGSRFFFALYDDSPETGVKPAGVGTVDVGVLTTSVVTVAVVVMVILSVSIVVIVPIYSSAGVPTAAKNRPSYQYLLWLQCRYFAELWSRLSMSKWS